MALKNIFRIEKKNDINIHRYFFPFGHNTPKYKQTKQLNKIKIMFNN